MAKKILGFFVASILCYNAVYAGTLLVPEAANYFNAGVRAQKGKNYIEAETNYKKALVIDHISAKWKVLVANNRGVMYAEVGDLEGAEELFNFALELDPNFKPAQQNIEFIVETRRTELESLKYWIKVLNIDLEKAKPKGYVIGEAVED